MPLDTHQAASVSLAPTHDAELEELVGLRIEAMRASLERLGRFDAQRARERLVAGFAPEFTRHILLGGERVGFVTVKPTPAGLTLEHLYVRPRYQARGVGSAVLGAIFEEADSRGLALHVGALRGSDANRFYVRHGFILTEQSAWDIYYVRAAQPRPPER
jgi:GNAT superfamily N-acetyltransferase